MGLVARGKDVAINHAIDWLLRKGELAPVLPGVYAPGPLVGKPLLAAVLTWRPDVVLVGKAAAALFFEQPWPERIEVLAWCRAPANPDVVVHRRRLDPGCISEVDGVRVTHPAVTAVWMAATDDGDTIDAALRLGRVTLDQLEWATTAMGARKGSSLWRRVVDDSRDQPWSAAERLAHRQLRAAGITGWRTNHWLRAGDMYFPADIVFERAKLVIEVDGFEFHGSRETFERDRAKTNALVREGWTVLRVTWSQLECEGYLVGLVREVLERLP